MSWNIEAFKEKIENEHTFPGPYIFKFIVPLAKKEDVLDLLPDGDLSFRNSANNTYVSITLKAQMANGESVVSVYKSVYSIEGIVAL